MTRLAERSGLKEYLYRKIRQLGMETRGGSLRRTSIMKILIWVLEVGSSLAEMLVSDDKRDVTVVDTHTEAPDILQENLICDSCWNSYPIGCSQDAGIEDADMWLL